MDDEVSSWVRRAKFSHTVCHRLDSSVLGSVPFTIQLDRIPGSKSRPRAVTMNPKPGDTVTQVERNPATNKPRALSPLPEMKVSDAFREARSSQKRFSTPHPQRKEPEKMSVGKLHSRESKMPKPKVNARALKHFTTFKFNDRSKGHKDGWTKYFDHGVGRVISVETADDCTIDLSKLFVGHRFAHGAHSQLYHGVYNEEPVAVKIIRVPEDDETGALGVRLERQFAREVTLLSRLHHPNVIKFVAASKMPLVFCIVTEYLAEGSLRAYLHKLEHKSLPLQTLLSMALEIAKAMEYIHSQHIIHRDLKPENILIAQDFHLKVADFGIACEQTHCDLLADDPGTYRWMAPEMIRRKHYCRKVDVYGFGLILWEFVSGTIPFEDKTPVQAAYAVVSKNMRPAIPGYCPSALKALIEQCWSVQPEKRPEFWQIVKVLEQFQTSLDRDGTLNLIQNPTHHDHKKGLLHWIQKLGPADHNSSSMPKPKFS